MFSRTFSPIALVLGIAACSGGPDNQSGLAEAEAEATRSRASDGRISCAVEGSPNFSENCTVQQLGSASGVVLTISSPSGSFRRLLITGDGRGVVAADGAEPAVVTTIGEGLIEVSLGGDRYRLPATVKRGSGQDK